MKKSICIVISVIMLFCLSGCELLESTATRLRGELIGTSFNIYFYDNYGTGFLTVSGQKVGINSNRVYSTSANYENSSVITITVDGNNMEQVGNTVIFEETGLKKIKDFSLPENIETGGGTINYIDKNINHFKNILGTEKVIVICSQLGIPITVYGGNSVYWEIPSDLPKMTRLSIDGKALYIHRANYVMLDKNMLS